jgi:hypothetical protein
MNTMNIPGFTAENSLYIATGHYQCIRNQSGEAGKQDVNPQQFEFGTRFDPSLSYCMVRECRLSHTWPYLYCFWVNRCLYPYE